MADNIVGDDRGEGGKPSGSWPERTETTRTETLDWRMVVETLDDASRERLTASNRRAWNSKEDDPIAIRDKIIGTILGELAAALGAALPPPPPEEPPHD